LGAFSREKALALASGLEQGASHPIALEVLREARERHIRPERVAVVQAEPNGVSALWEGLEVKIGAAEFLSEMGIDEVWTRLALDGKGVGYALEALGIDVLTTEATTLRELISEIAQEPDWLELKSQESHP